MKVESKIIIIIVALLLIISSSLYALSDKHIPATLFGGKELNSPGDWIKESQIGVYKNRVVLDIKNSTWSTFTNTNSMDPFIDEKSHAIEIMPKDADEINVGDVISYETSYGTLIHRVVEKGVDKKGIYFIVKGDNNRLEDPFKVRFSQVKGVVVAVIY